MFHSPVVSSEFFQTRPWLLLKPRDLEARTFVEAVCQLENDVSFCFFYFFLESDSRHNAYYSRQKILFYSSSAIFRYTKTS